MAAAVFVGDFEVGAVLELRHFRLEAGHDVLCRTRLLSQSNSIKAVQFGNAIAVDGVECRVHFVEYVEGCGITFLHGHHHSQCDDRLLSA